MVEEHYPDHLVYDEKQLCNRCARLSRDAIWLFVIGWHVYVMIRGIQPFGIL